MLTMTMIFGVYRSYCKTKNAWLLCLKGQTGAHSGPLHQGPWKASYAPGYIHLK